MGKRLFPSSICCALQQPNRNKGQPSFQLVEHKHARSNGRILSFKPAGNNYAYGYAI